MSHWVYHPTEEAKIVPTAEYHVLLREGWYDTPANFPSNNIPESSEVKKEEVRLVENQEEIVKRPRGRPPRSVHEV